MSKIIVLQMGDRLPKERNLAVNYHRNKCYLCQTFHFSAELRKITEQKIKNMQVLASKSLAKIETVIKQEDQIHIIYESVQNKLISVVQNSSMLFINGIYGQLKLLQEELINSGIAINFNLHRFGIDQTGSIKYFLDLDFEYGSTAHLSNFYNRQIYSLLTYFCHNNTHITQEEKIQIFNKIASHSSLKTAAPSSKSCSQFFQKLPIQQEGQNHQNQAVGLDEKFRDQALQSSFLQSYQGSEQQENQEDIDDIFELSMFQQQRKVVELSGLSASEIQELVQREIERTKKVAKGLHNLYKNQQ